jgi:hypothetical protein
MATLFSVERAFSHSRVFQSFRAPATYTSHRLNFAES